MSTAGSLDSYKYSKIPIAARLGSVSSSTAIPHFSTEKALLGAQLLGYLSAYPISPVRRKDNGIASLYFSYNQRYRLALHQDGQNCHAPVKLEHVHSTGVTNQHKATKA